MYSRILWATDGSPHADAALREALALLEPGGEIIAFHSDQRFVGSHIGGTRSYSTSPIASPSRRAVDGLLRDGIAVPSSSSRHPRPGTRSPRSRTSWASTRSSAEHEAHGVTAS